MRRAVLALACLAVPLILAAALAAASPAGAATILLGPADLSASDPFAECGTDCSTRTFVPTAVPGATLVAPADGTVVSWRVKGAPPKRLRLRVVRAAGGGQFSGIDTSGIATVGDGAGSIPAAIEIGAGDQLGIQLETNFPTVNPSTLLGGSLLGATWSGFTPGLPDGTTAAPTETGSGAVPLFNATVELHEPRILHMTSTSGPTGGGDVVVLTGEHLAVATAVRFGSVPAAQVTKADGNQVIAVAPPHPPGTVEVTVETAGGSSVDSTADRYEYVEVGPPAPGPHVAPALSALRIAPNAFRAARSGPSAVAAAARGAEVTFRSSEAARVRFRIQRHARGRYVRMRGSFSRTAVAGPNGFRLTGRLRGKPLPPGSYRLLARAVDGRGQASKALKRGFRVVR